MQPHPLLSAYQHHLTATRGLSPLTLRNYLSDLAPFLEYLERQGLNLDGPDGALRRFVERHGPEYVAQEYRYLLRDYVAWLLERRRLRSGRRAGQLGHQRASVVRCMAAIRSFFRYLVREGLLPDAPVWAPRSTVMRGFTPRLPRRLPQVLSAGEAALLVEAPASLSSIKPPAALRDMAALELLYGSGLRVSELAGLDLADVSLASRSVRVWGKGHKARSVPLGRSAVAALRRYLDEARPSFAGARAVPALLLGHRGGRLTVRSVQALVRRYAAAAGLRDGLHPHSLRHSFATHLLDGGADLRIVQELLGHSTPRATQVYTQVSQAEARRVYLAAHPLAREAPPAP